MARSSKPQNTSRATRLRWSVALPTSHGSTAGNLRVVVCLVTDEERLRQLVKDVRTIRKQLTLLVERCQKVSARDQWVRLRLEYVRQREKLRRTKDLLSFFDDNQDGMIH